MRAASSNVFQSSLITGRAACASRAATGGSRQRLILDAAHHIQRQSAVNLLRVGQPEVVHDLNEFLFCLGQSAQQPPPPVSWPSSARPLITSCTSYLYHTQPNNTILLVNAYHPSSVSHCLQSEPLHANVSACPLAASMSLRLRLSRLGDSVILCTAPVLASGEASGVVKLSWWTCDWPSAR